MKSKNTLELTNNQFRLFFAIQILINYVFLVIEFIEGNKKKFEGVERIKKSELYTVYTPDFKVIKSFDCP